MHLDVWRLSGHWICDLLKSTCLNCSVCRLFLQNDKFAKEMERYEGQSVDTEACRLYQSKTNTHREDKSQMSSRLSNLQIFLSNFFSLATFHL